MDSVPRCQDCGGFLEIDKSVGGRRAQSVRFCERCTERRDMLEAAEKRRTIISVIAGAIVLTALVFFLLARG